MKLLRHPGLLALAPLLAFAAVSGNPETKAADTPRRDEVTAAKSADTPANFTTTPDMKMETRATVYCLETQHLLHRRIADMGMEELIGDYASKLDPSRMFLLAGDVEKARQRHGVMLDVWLESGNLIAAFDIYKDFMGRVDKRVAWINARLDQPFDFTTRESFVADRAKADRPATLAEADALWEKRLKYDLLLELLGDRLPGDGESDDDAAGAEKSAEIKPPPASITPEKLAAATAKLKKRYTRMKHYLALEPGEVEELFLNALAGRYDPHSSFFSKQTLEEFDIAMRNSLCGIGALLGDEDGYCTVKEILPGGPLEKNGKVKPGDRIVALGENGGEPEDIVGMRLNKVVQRMRGKQGTKISLVIEPAADRAARFTLNLNRDEIKLTTQLASARVFEVPTVSGNTLPVGVIELPAFYGKTGDEGEAYSTTRNVEELILKLKKHDIRALVMDLRTNGGGLLNEAVDLAGLFIPKGPVLQVKDTDGNIRHLDDENNKVVWDGPLVVLVSKLSASASEIFAGALQDHKRALIVGDDHTHGKGSVQAVIHYDRIDTRLKAAAKVTIQKWYLPGGNSIQLKGVASDVVVPSVYSILPVSESDLERPLAWDSIPSAMEGADLGDVSKIKVRITPDLVRRLKESSAGRQARLPEFLALNRSIAWTGDRVQQKELSLNFVERRQGRLDDLAFRDALKGDLKRLETEDGFKTETVKLLAAEEQDRKEAAATGKPAKSLREKRAKLGATGADPDWPDFDVQLRESLRIAGDWAAMIPEPATGAHAPDTAVAAEARK